MNDNLSIYIQMKNFKILLHFHPFIFILTNELNGVYYVMLCKLQKTDTNHVN